MKQICPSVHEISSRVQRSLAREHAPHASMSKIHARMKLARSPLHVRYASMDVPASIAEPFSRSLAEMRARSQLLHAREHGFRTFLPAGAGVPASFRFHVQRCHSCEHTGSYWQRPYARNFVARKVLAICQVPDKS